MRIEQSLMKVLKYNTELLTLMLLKDDVNVVVMVMLAITLIIDG